MDAFLATENFSQKKILKSWHDCQDHFYQLVLLWWVAGNIYLEPCGGHKFIIGILLLVVRVLIKSQQPAKKTATLRSEPSTFKGKWVYCEWVKASNCLQHLIAKLPTFISYQSTLITLMIVENRALWLDRGFALSRYNHRTMIIALKASSFQNGSQIFWCFGVRNWSIIFIFSNNHQCNYTKQLVASGDLNIGE